MLIKICDLIEQKPFSTLLEIKREVFTSIRNDMENNGYDNSQPIIIWGNIIIDGHTRAKAARELGIIEIPAILKDFENEDAALAYAIHNQRDRRNLTAGDLLSLILAADKLRERTFHGNQYKSGKGSTDPLPKSTAEVTAELVGCSCYCEKRKKLVKGKQ